MSISQGTQQGLIQSGLNIGQSLFQSLITGIQNRRQRKYEQRMYGRNLQDSRDSWSLQNQYNDPAQQMLRLKNAGLNPNLVYGGTANTGNAQQVNTPSPSISRPQDIQAPQAPQLSDIYNLARTDAQTDLLRQKVITEGLTQTLTALTTSMKELELSKDKATYQTQIDQLKSNLDLTLENIRSQQLNQDQTRAATDKIIQDNLRAAEAQKWTIKETIQKIAESKQRITQSKANIGLINSQKEMIDLKKVEQEVINALAPYGVKPGEPIVSYLGKISLQSIAEIISNFFK